MAQVHAIGIGAVGTLLAHQIGSHAPATPIKLILRSQAAISTFRRNGSLLSVADASAGSREASHLEPVRLEAERGDDRSNQQPIKILFSMLKAPACLPALRQLAPRLSYTSTVVLLHNGLGVREELIRGLWPDKSQRPTLIQGITSAGIRTLDPFSVQLEGRGAWTFAAVPSAASSADTAVSASLLPTINLLSTLTRASGSLITPSIVPRRQFEDAALLKLAINAAINPLTALFRVPNGELAREAFRPLLDLLIEETSVVLRSLVDADGRPLLPSSDFATEALKATVMDVARRTASNRSSMLVDVEAGRPTEIDFISGHLVRLAASTGKAAPLNALLREKVATLGSSGAASLTVTGLLCDFRSSLSCS